MEVCVLLSRKALILLVALGGGMMASGLGAVGDAQPPAHSRFDAPGPGAVGVTLQALSSPPLALLDAAPSRPAGSPADVPPSLTDSLTAAGQPPSPEPRVEAKAVPAVPTATAPPPSATASTPLPAPTPMPSAAPVVTQAAQAVSVAASPPPQTAPARATVAPVTPRPGNGAGTSGAGATVTVVGASATASSLRAKATPVPTARPQGPAVSSSAGLCAEGTPQCNDYSLKLPIRAAFYYGWYPEMWTDASHIWDAVLGEYSSTSPALINTHIDQMQYAGIQAGLYSWWGPQSTTDSRLPLFLQQARPKGFKWAIYYELDQDGTLAIEGLRGHMTYLQAYMFRDPAYLHVGGKPVVFVYAPSATCQAAPKWTQLKQEFGLYVSMTDVPNWWTCDTLDSWHGYRPAQEIYAVYYQPTNTVHSISVSAGFWSAAEWQPRLIRDYLRWENNVKAMVLYQPRWQLVYFNEFGEGTNIEPSDAQCDQPGCTDYLITLHDNR